jgi:pimeloyl-ACP methyl ester carboxylesterase
LQDKLGATEVAMNQSRTDTLEVPGATLHYEVRGAGPVLLLIPGGPADAGAFDPIRGELSDRYTVVTYDPRGLSRSPLDGEPEGVTVGTFADDARRLLAALGTEPAYVLGSSGGALVGLELISRHPERVRAMVAHEPPLPRLLDDADEHSRFAREVHDTYLSEGVGPAMGKFLASAGLDGGPPEPPAGPAPEVDEAMARMQGNLDFFLGHMWLALGDYAPDVSRLRPLPITVAVGEASEGQLAYRAAVALAERLGKEPAVFPGDHGGFNTHPEAFAARLEEVLGGRGASARPGGRDGAAPAK